MLPHVFDLFTQAERAPDRTQGGLGIGLALVKALVDLHGGSVAARSNQAAAGTTFTIALNVHEEGEAVETPQEQSVSSASASTLRMLVVDDNSDAADMLASFFKAAGHHVTVCYPPTQALDHAEKGSFDASILDIGLPEMDGNMLARRLRQLSGKADALFIAIIGYGVQFNRQTAMQAGFDHYVVKPADPHALLKMLEQRNPRSEQFVRQA